jgi:hypothetical protein
MTDVQGQLKALEERIASLESGLAAANTNTDQLRDFVVRLDVEHRVAINLGERKTQSIFDLLRKQKEWAEAESDLLRKTRHAMSKLRDVYYHVFPERLAEDVRALEAEGEVDTASAADADIKS